MTPLKIALALLFALSAQPALACGCDIDCPPGEEYSDEEEMCVAKSDAIS